MWYLIDELHRTQTTEAKIPELLRSSRMMSPACREIPDTVIIIRPRLTFIFEELPVLENAQAREQFDLVLCIPALLGETFMK
jgi:hypothetical protein